jgi:hypothetical protein
MERKISLDPRVRAEAESLRRTWDLLDFLPKPEPKSDFTAKTLSKLEPARQAAKTDPKIPPVPTSANVGTVPTSPSRSASTVPAPPPLPTLSPQPNPRWPIVLAASWAASVVVALVVGYVGYHRMVPREPGDAELVRDLRLIENKRFYDAVEDVDFLKQLADPELFGEDSGS